MTQVSVTTAAAAARGKALRAAMPLLLTVGGFVLIGGLCGYRLYQLGPTPQAAMCAAAVALYAGWLGWESRVSVAEVGKRTADHDRGTMEMAAAAKITLLLAALLPPSHVMAAAALPGLALMALGIALRTTAIRQLGAAYSHRIRVPALPLVERGLYARLRHPAYLGTLLAHAGVALVFFNPWSLAALALLWAPAVLMRTLVEDRCLMALLPEYAAYARRVPALLLPGLY
ncbi:MAG TPA: isoprenylcysteine carboxylmethyltransferase family protein [Ideonella sp.]|uniref:methyltransferase family protein n=1 Tax=Ideonella sp. TaxID=1929293 RepID=UPI002CEEF1A4|nr:isoprenylcysteine carboxylmethyltransferase family protein [Ideonella sp.]HSI48682.1 isoprenylcysteine carboxylmethyltransferase family protein [Ideonella sp.]